MEHVSNGMFLFQQLRQLVGDDSLWRSESIDVAEQLPNLLQEYKRGIISSVMQPMSPGVRSTTNFVPDDSDEEEDDEEEQRHFTLSPHIVTAASAPKPHSSVIDSQIKENKERVGNLTQMKIEMKKMEEEQFEIYMFLQENEDDVVEEVKQTWKYTH